MASGHQKRRRSNDSDSSRGSGGSGGYETAPETPAPSSAPVPDPTAVAAAQAAWRTVARQTGSWQSDQPSDPPYTYYMLNCTDRGLELLRSAGSTAWQAVTNERARQAVIEGAPFVVQGAGFIANRPDIIGAGVGLAAMEGVKEVLTAAYRTYQIWAHPELPQQNPNWIRAAAGVTNIVANSLYGRGNAGEGPMKLTGGAGILVGTSLIARNLAPDAGRYVPQPTLPLYQQPNVPLQPLQADRSSNPHHQVAGYAVPHTSTHQQKGSSSVDAQQAALTAQRRGNGNNSAGNSSHR